MTRVLVTGCWSRQCNPAVSVKDVSVAWLLAEVCRDLGYEVEHRDPQVDESFADFDHVFLGLAPLHSLGCNRSYGALACFARTYRDRRVTLYLDDAATQNVENGIQTWFNEPARGFKPFYNYRKGYERAIEPQWREYLLHAVSVLRNYEWPPTIIPAFPWADVDQLTARTPRLTQPVALDLSAYLPVYVDDTQQTGTRDVWITETRNEKWLEQQRPQLPVRRFGPEGERRPNDVGLVYTYRESLGVLEPGENHGWWYSRLAYAAQADAPFVTRWQNVQSLGASYSLLAEDVEGMTHDARLDLAHAQASVLADELLSHEEIKKSIRNLVEASA